MKFVTANDSAWVENKRGASGSVLNGAEEWLREMVVVAREVGVDYIDWHAELAKHGACVWQEKECTGR